MLPLCKWPGRGIMSNVERLKYNVSVPYPKLGLAENTGNIELRAAPLALVWGMGCTLIHYYQCLVILHNLPGKLSELPFSSLIFFFRFLGLFVLLVLF